MARKVRWGLGAVVLLLVVSPAWAWIKPTPVDVDKFGLRKEGGEWKVDPLWYEDGDGPDNGKWDTGEKTSNTEKEGWTPVSQDLTCWQAAGANILSAGGWGDAKVIYEEMVDEMWRDKPGFGGIPQWDGGDECVAVEWWLNTQKNPDGTWKDKKSPYVVYTHWDVTKITSAGYGGMAEFLGDQLRQCQFVTLGIYPAQGMGHAVTVWGDDKTAEWKKGDASPQQVWITDSDWEDEDETGKERDLQSCTWEEAWMLTYHGKERRTLDACTLCTPEPGVILLLLLGAPVAWWARRRRNT